MNLSVDASVAVKWFVSEPLSENARLLLAHRLDLYAPDILLAEFANVISKKIRRRELQASPRYMDALSSFSENITLRPVGDLIERAMQISLEIEHPVYDCLYLACAEETESKLVTADRKLVNKVSGRSLAIDIDFIGAVGFADEVSAAATAPVIRKETVVQLIEAHDRLAETRESVRDARHGQARPFIIETSEDFGFYFDSVTYRRLADLFRELDNEERIDLLALGWLGQHRDEDWPSLYERACKMIDMVDEHYTLGLGQHWREGYERLTGVSL